MLFRTVTGMVSTALSVFIGSTSRLQWLSPSCHLPRILCVDVGVGDLGQSSGGILRPELIHFYGVWPWACTFIYKSYYYNAIQYDCPCIDKFALWLNIYINILLFPLISSAERLSYSECIVAVQFSSVQFKMVSVCSGKPIYAPPHLSEIPQVLPIHPPVKHPPSFFSFS